MWIPFCVQKLSSPSRFTVWIKAPIHIPFLAEMVDKQCFISWLRAGWNGLSSECISARNKKVPYIVRTNRCCWSAHCRLKFCLIHGIAPFFCPPHFLSCSHLFQSSLGIDSPSPHHVIGIPGDSNCRKDSYNYYYYQQFDERKSPLRFHQKPLYLPPLGLNCGGKSGDHPHVHVIEPSFVAVVGVNVSDLPSTIS